MRDMSVRDVSVRDKSGYRQEGSLGLPNPVKSILEREIRYS